jgi:DNA mismatch repair ATPase MutS
MRLDAAAQRALHVFPARGDANAAFSLYGLMCRARTPMGKRRLKVRAARRSAARRLRPARAA